MQTDLADLSPLGRAAIELARLGWYVFPLHGVAGGWCTCGDRSEGHRRKAGKHPRVPGGFKCAATDEATITAWWRKLPDANIGLACGASGLFILDVDPPGDGHGEGDGPAALAELEAVHGPLPPTVEARAGGAGRHVYLKAPPGVEVKISAGKVGPGLDVRAAGGYIVAPPSAHRSGGVYAWAPGASPADRPLAVAPPWLVDLAGRPGPAERATPGAGAEGGAVLAEGQRNAGLASFAGKCRRAGMTGAELEAAVLAFNVERCRPPLPEDEARGVARSVQRYAVTDEADDNGPAVWPELPPEAYYGLAGEVVRILEPCTEADPVAVYVSLLVAAGNIMGRGRYVSAGYGEEIHANVQAALVGATSVARKGTSWGAARGFLSLAFKPWTEQNIGSGYGSGEALIADIGDPGPERKNKKGEVYREPPGTEDKRRLVMEPELVRLWSIGRREGATLGPVLRDAADSPPVLHNKVKGSPYKATRPHVSMLAHATPGELRARLDLSEARGGSYNRLAWFLVRRRAALPNPPPPDAEALKALSDRFGRAVALGMAVAEVRKTPAAAELWESVYPRLSGPVDELGQNYLGRAHAHALRFALILATLDERSLIDAPHLRSALALVAYVEASVRYIFGGAGDGLAARVLALLGEAGPQGLGRTELRLAAGKPKAERFNATLAELEAARRVARRMETTLGRPAEVWIVTECDPKRSKRPGTLPGPLCAPSEAGQEVANKGQEGTPRGAY